MIVVIGEFEKYDSLREELLVLLVRKIFFGCLFYVGIETKRFDLVQSLCITYEKRRKMSKCQKYMDS